MSTNDDIVLMSIGALSILGATYMYSRAWGETEIERQQRRLRERVEREMRDVESRRSRRVAMETEEILRIRRKMERERRERSIQEREQQRRLRERVDREMRDVESRRNRRVAMEREEILELEESMDLEEQRRKFEEWSSQQRRFRDRLDREMREKNSRQYIRRRIENYRRFNDLDLLEKWEEYSKIVQEGGKLTDDQKVFVDRMEQYMAEYTRDHSDLSAIDPRDIQHYLRNREIDRRLEELEEARKNTLWYRWSTALESIIGRRDDRAL